MAKKNADAVLCGDLHIRDDQPLCRTDDYFSTQMKKLTFLLELAEKNNYCPIFCSGDFFNKAKSSKALEIAVMDLLFAHEEVHIHSIPGNHDLPNHNLDNFKDSSLGVLSASKALSVFLAPLEEFQKMGVVIKDRNVGMIHKLLDGGNPVKAQDKILSYSAKKLMKEHLEYSLILSGDNHQTFVSETSEGRVLVNPGSMMRMRADQAEHKPCVFLWYADTNEVKKVFIPIEEDVIDRTHIDLTEEYNERLESFIDSVNENYDVSLNFGENIKHFLLANEVREPVKNKIWEFVSTK